ncbi:MAG: ABC transporter ATP-binding protein [Thermoleophilaceae bacterium]
MPIDAETEEGRASIGAGVAVAMSGIRKSFDGVVAVEDVDFEARPGEIHALLGENGAGKTTLMSVLAGMLKPDAGEIRLDGDPVTLGSPRDALRHGIGMVPQHPALVPNLSVADNLILGRESSWRPRLRRAALDRWASELRARYGAEVDLRAPAGALAIDEVQQVEILRLLGKDVRSLILDEPTAVLAQAHAARLFAALKRLRDEGCAIVIVTHKLKEVMELADRATVLRRGRLVRSFERSEFDEDALAGAVVGSELKAFVRSEGRAGEARAAARPGLDGRSTANAVLVADGLVVRGASGARAVDGLSLEVRAGEILGIAGVEGNGQAELVEALAGVREIDAGALEIDGCELGSVDPRQLDRLGVGVVSGDRLRWDVVPELSISENLLLSELVDPRSCFGSWGFLSWRRIRDEVAKRMSEFDVRAAEAEQAVGKLSGGNQQRVVLARELSRRPRLVIAAYPTRGLDVAAVRFVHQTLSELRDQGTAVLLVSADRDELFALSDRVGVLYRGRMAYESATATVDQRELGRAMVGLGAGCSHGERPQVEEATTA